MKRSLCVIFSLVLLCSCSAERSVTGTVNDTTRAAGLKYDYEIGYIKSDDVYAYYGELNRGDKATVTGESDKYYEINCNGVTLLAEKSYIRKASEGEYEAWTGYAKKNAGIYADMDLEEKIESLSQNDTVRVIDGFKGILVIEMEDGSEGYMSSASVSASKIVTRTYTSSPSSVTESTENYNGGGGSSSGGSSSGGDSTPAPAETPSTSGDGQDFSLSYKGKVNTFNLNDDSEEGVVLMDHLKTYIRIYSYGQEVKVLDYDEDSASVLVDGRVGTIDRRLIRMNEDETFESYTVYAKSGGDLYTTYFKTKLYKSLSVNTELKVIDKIGSTLIVEYNDGIYFISESDTSTSKITVKKYTVPSATTTESAETYSSGGGGGGSAAPSTPSEPVQEWTEPAL